MPISAGWAIELKGHRVDLSDFERGLAPPHNPWVERDGEMLLLRSKTWAGMEDSGHVMDEGRRLIELLNGAAKLVHDDARWVQLGGIRRFDDSGQSMPVIITARMGAIELSSRVRFYASVSPEPVTVVGPSLMQRAIAKAEKDTSDIRAELLLHIARADNWFDLYKAMELAELILGGRHKFERALNRQGHGDDSAVWDDVHRTANHYRHAPPKANSLPANPPTTPEDGLIRIVPTLRRVVRGEL